MLRSLACALLLCPSAAFAADACLDAALPLAGPADALHGQLVVTALDADGAADTKVLGPVVAPNARLTGDEGFRVASVTKTYVAATALRLWEDGRLELEAPITRYLPEAWTALLAGDGYTPHDVTVRHLLSHTGGLADHAQHPNFIATIKADPATEWSRSIDVQKLVEWTDPLGAPGEKFAYSDTGYVLLGAIIEGITGQDLPVAVRGLLQLDRLDIPGTWWERYEQPDGRVRAHQLFEGLDTYDWNPSLDLFGGGGLVMSTRDMAVFFDALLEGRVYRKAGTLATMTSKADLPGDSPYRLGIFEYDLAGVPAWGHSGFWGTFVAREPTSGRTIAAAVTDRRDYPKLQAVANEYIKRVYSLRAAAAPGAGAAQCAVAAVSPPAAAAASPAPGR